MKYLIFVLYFCIFCISKCYPNFDKAVQKSDSIKKIKKALVKSLTPKLVCIHFLEWYKQNEDRLHKIKILIGGGRDTSTYYSVDYDNANLYLLELKKSGYLSKKYTDSLYAYIKRCDETLRKYPQNDGPAQGFEGDLIMKAQDYMGIMENIDNPKIISKKRSRNSINIVFVFTKYEKITFELSKYNRIWLIDTINGNFPIEILHY